MPPKVTVNPHRASPLPSQEVIQTATQEHLITDARGRSITLKKPGILAQYRLVEAMGAESAKNEVYMGMILPVIFVAAIDGVQVVAPSNKAQIEALIVRLDEEGIAAVAQGVQDHFGAQDPEADKEALKK